MMSDVLLSFIFGWMLEVYQGFTGIDQTLHKSSQINVHRICVLDARWMNQDKYLKAFVGAQMGSAFGAKHFRGYKMLEDLNKLAHVWISCSGSRCWDQVDMAKKQVAGYILEKPGGLAVNFLSLWEVGHPVAGATASTGG